MQKLSYCHAGGKGKSYSSYSLLTLALGGSECSASPPAALNRRYELDGRLGGP
jgi:hypothetical protein